MAKPDFIIRCPRCRWSHDEVRVTVIGIIGDVANRKILVEYVSVCRAPRFVLPYLKYGLEPYRPPYRGLVVEAEDTCFAAEPILRRSKKHQSS